MFSFRVVRWSSIQWYANVNGDDGGWVSMCGYVTTKDGIVLYTVCGVGIRCYRYHDTALNDFHPPFEISNDNIECPFGSISHL